jgi:IS5 family transposase
MDGSTSSSSGWGGASAAMAPMRSRVEHVFAEQKSRMALFIRTVGIARATTKIGLVNILYNIKRLIYLNRNVAA